MSEDRLCHCGTLEDAVRHAERLYVELAGVECPVWALQVATALSIVAYEKLDIGDETKSVTVTLVGAATAEHHRPDEVDRAVEKKREQLI